MTTEDSRDTMVRNLLKFCDEKSPHYDTLKCSELMQKFNEFLITVKENLEIFQAIRNWVRAVDLKLQKHHGKDPELMGKIDDIYLTLAKMDAGEVVELEKLVGRKIIERCPKCDRVLLTRRSGLPELTFVSKSGGE